MRKSKKEVCQTAKKPIEPKVSEGRKEEYYVFLIMKIKKHVRFAH